LGWLEAAPKAWKASEKARASLQSLIDRSSLIGMVSLRAGAVRGMTKATA